MRVKWKGIGSPITYEDFDCIVYLQGDPSGDGMGDFIDLPDMTGWGAGPMVQVYSDINADIELRAAAGNVLAYGKPVAPQTKVLIQQGDWLTLMWVVANAGGQWIVRGTDFVPTAPA